MSNKAKLPELPCEAWFTCPAGTPHPVRLIKEWRHADGALWYQTTNAGELVKVDQLVFYRDQIFRRD